MFQHINYFFNAEPIEILFQIKDIMAGFLFYYPILMSIVWMIGATYFFLRHEFRKPTIPDLKEFPLVSILIPAHNEETCILATTEKVLETAYPNFEIIIIDDGSTDSTPEIIKDIANKYPKVRVMNLKENMGKPYALRCGAIASLGEIILTIDADATINPDTIHWLVSHFLSGPRVGAVTGNPRVRNRTSLLAKIQVGEYASIIGMIKRTQRILGKVLSVSGVIAAFRREAIFDVGLWDLDMITDDINITWKLEKRFWDVRYEPNAICWVLVPEKIKGLFRQRVRWAQGGVEVMKRHTDIWKSWKQRRLWPVYIEYIISIFWAYTFFIFAVLWISGLIFNIEIPGFSLIPMWNGYILALVCLAQFAVGMIVDTRYEKYFFKYLFWVIWYPIFFWIITALATVWATPKALFKKNKELATWVSPDRGLTRKV